jgi:hypothetical protein
MLKNERYLLLVKELSWRKKSVPLRYSHSLSAGRKALASSAAPGGSQPFLYFPQESNGFRSIPLDMNNGMQHEPIY